MLSPFRKNDVLVAGLIARDKNAIEYFFRRYFHGLKLYVEMDEDLAMEAFEIALEKISDYNPLKSKFITWVYRIGRNLFLKRKRKDNQEQTVFAEDLLRNYDEADTGGDDREEWIAPTAYSEELYGDFFKSRFVDAEFKHQIDRAIKMLSTDEREILKDYCKRSKKKFPENECKTVFKKLRMNLNRIQRAEEKTIAKRLSVK